MKAIILAAGMGKRLGSEQAQIPKAMREICGKPMLNYVLDSVNFIEKYNIIIVVGFLGEKIKNAFSEYLFAEQSQQLGTGHAVKCAKDLFKDYDGEVLILPGDMPLIKRETILSLHEFHKNNGNDCTILSCIMDENLAFGRIIYDENKNFLKILEAKDCPPELKFIKEYNTSVMIFDSKKLFEQLENLSDKNASKEFYLTDVPALFRDKKYKVGVFANKNKSENYGVNSLEDLKIIEDLIKKS